jgi:hypothetical protein
MNPHAHANERVMSSQETMVWVGFSLALFGAGPPAAVTIATGEDFWGATQAFFLVPLLMLVVAPILASIALVPGQPRLPRSGVVAGVVTLVIAVAFWVGVAVTFGIGI